MHNYYLYKCFVYDMLSKVKGLLDLYYDNIVKGLIALEKEFCE